MCQEKVDFGQRAFLAFASRFFDSHGLNELPLIFKYPARYHPRSVGGRPTAPRWFCIHDSGTAFYRESHHSIRFVRLLKRPENGFNSLGHVIQDANGTRLAMTRLYKHLLIIPQTFIALVPKHLCSNGVSYSSSTLLAVPARSQTTFPVLRHIQFLRAIQAERTAQYVACQRVGAAVRYAEIIGSGLGMC